MKESFIERLMKNVATAIVIIGVVVAIFKGVDRQDVLLGISSGVFSSMIGALLFSLGYFFGIFAVGKNSENEEKYSEEYCEEVLGKKKKRATVSVCTFAVFALLLIAEYVFGLFYAPVKIESLTKSCLYEQAFDCVIESKLSTEKKAEYSKMLYPYLQEAFENGKNDDAVLTIDDMKVLKRENKLFLERAGKKELLYTGGEYGGKVNIGNDFIYSCGQIIFIEEISEGQRNYKNVVALDLKTKNYQILLYETDAFYFDKLKNGNILLSDKPCRVYDPVKRKVLKTELKNEEWDYIYTTM